MLTIPSAPYAIQLARPLTEVNRTLHRITLFLILIAAGGIAVAAGLGLVVCTSGAGAGPPADRDDRVGHRDRETSRNESSRPSEDELGRLASSFNTMLAALEESSRAQRQLVADASHELRTPLTSLRTNIEVLARGDKLARRTRERLLEDVVEQIGEMTSLIGELIELARGERGEESSRGRAPRPDRRRSRGARAAEPARRLLRRPTSRSRPSTARRPRSSARLRTCSTTRPSGARPAARSRSASVPARSPSVTTAPGSPRRTCPTSSTASTARGPPAACRAPGSASRS